jgi:hypothetical protein
MVQEVTIITSVPVAHCPNLDRYTVLIKVLPDLPQSFQIVKTILFHTQIPSDDEGHINLLIPSRIFTLKSL